MALLKIHLQRNLRRTVLRGHPWIYREALSEAPAATKAQLAQVFDGKKEFLAWAMYDPHSPLNLRILSLDKKLPDAQWMAHRFSEALKLRRNAISENTNCYRLFNGEGDLLPGLVCDVYAGVAVLQFDGQGPGEFWDREMITSWLLQSGAVESVVEKFRRHTQAGLQFLGGQPCDYLREVTEHGARFKVDIEHGQKTGFFIDQRENRNYLRSVSKNLSVLNLFSYSGGFSVNAGLGHASQVTSVDVAQGAIDLANENWRMNGLNPQLHQGITADVFQYLAQSKELWDHIVVDPPSMGHSEEHKSRAQGKYIELFTTAIKKVKPEGQISLSSCSSHISFNDFYEIITESLSQARRRGRILRVSGQGPDHPFPHSAQELQYLKFFHLTLS